MLKIARAVYCDNFTVAWDCPACNIPFEVYSVISESGNFGITGYLPSRDAIVVAFRGSDNIPNWIENLEAYRGPLSPMLPDVKGVRVHTGFRDSYVTMQPSVHSAIQNLTRIFPNASVLVTGHSLGGAQASLCALDLAVTFNITSRVITFGEPRLGNLAFAKYRSTHSSSLVRWTNQRDLVPHVPLTMLMGFVHGPRESWIHDSSNHYKVCSATIGEDPECSDGALFQLSIRDHLNYFNVHTSNCSPWPEVQIPDQL